MLEHACFMRMGPTMREVNRMIYFPELVPGSKSTFTSRNFTFSMHVDVWWWNKGYIARNKYKFAV